MAEDRSGIENIQLAQEMKKSFLDYSMSVIVARALPDVRDGLKPVHRRILHGMNELGNTPDKAHKKSARIVGDVMGKYHPHGDLAIYDAMVRMAQDFSYRNPLVDGHGNFGSVDGDSAAAMRYTEARMSKIALALLQDINKNTVDYRENYDGSETEPVVLPSKFPNLLVNGASGIAVGMATNIPTHNLRETIEACRVVMHNPDATTADLMEVLPGPDFPTGGIILGKSGIRKGYETGRGSILIRAKTRIIEENNRETIIVDELPYLVNKARLHEKIVELARDKKIEGITAVRDESDRDGMRMVIEVRRDASAAVILNNLFKMTQLQTSFGFNMVAIVNGTPRTLSLKEIIEYYLAHQRDVIRRRTAFDKEKAEARAHILEGLRIALDHIDAIISIIRNSDTGAIAKERLINEYSLSERQAQAILDMRLVRLTGLERDKVEDEYQELMTLIADLADILANPERIDTIIEEEMVELADKFGDDRRTELMVGEALSIEDEDLIEVEEVVITLSHNGYMKRMPITEFKTQNRGGRGVKGMGTNDDDFVETILSTSTHDLILFFTNTGKVYKAKAYEIPEYGRTAKGIPALNFLGIDNDEHIEAMVAFRGTPDETEQFFFTTKLGTVKRTAVTEFQNIRQSGLIAINLNEGDELISVKVTNGDQNIVIGTKDGYAASFHEEDVRSMGRNATGVRGINLRDGDEVVGADILEPDSYVLAISENGYGKGTKAEEYGIRRRGGKGVKTFKITEKNGSLVGMRTYTGDEDVLLITNEGIIIRFSADNISITGRDTQGVRLMRLDEDQFISTMSIVQPEDEDETDDTETVKTDNVTELSDAETEDGALPSEVEDLLDRAEDDDSEE